MSHEASTSMRLLLQSSIVNAVQSHTTAVDCLSVVPYETIVILVAIAMKVLQNPAVLTTSGAARRSSLDLSCDTVVKFCSTP